MCNTCFLNDPLPATTNTLLQLSKVRARPFSGCNLPSHLRYYRQLAKLPASYRLRGGACCDPATDADNVSFKLRNGDLVILFVRSVKYPLNPVINANIQDRWPVRQRLPFRTHLNMHSRVSSIPASASTSPSTILSDRAGVRRGMTSSLPITLAVIQRWSYLLSLIVLCETKTTRRCRQWRNASCSTRHCA